MMKGVLPDFAERLSAAAKARQALLERAREKANDPELGRRQAERQAIARAREVRIAERKAARLAEERRMAEEAAAAEAARLKAEEEARILADLERAERQAALDAAREAARKAMYENRELNRKGRLKVIKKKKR
jgi:hypothetical protein